MQRWQKMPRIACRSVSASSSRSRVYQAVLAYQRPNASIGASSNQASNLDGPKAENEGVRTTPCKPKRPEELSKFARSRTLSRKPERLRNLAKLATLRPLPTTTRNPTIPTRWPHVGPSQPRHTIQQYRGTSSPVNEGEW